jgi:ubiquinone biosynthesis monooxygenase Coq7
VSAVTSEATPAIVARLRPGESIGDRILKVNHAGEHGAINIYRGQVLACRLRAPSLVETLRHFQRHEEGHRALFRAELSRRGRPRCRSYHLCGIGGFILGVVTGVIGRSAVAATTVAVERVVLRHLEAQLVFLRDRDQAAHAAVLAIVQEEREHHDRAEMEARSGRFWPRVLTPLVGMTTESVIWLGMNL